MGLHGICTMDDANRYLPEFMEDYNRRFGRVARNDHDAHRPLLERDHLDEIFTWQEERRVTAQLTVHHKRTMYLRGVAAGQLQQLRKHDDLWPDAAHRRAQHARLQRPVAPMKKSTTGTRAVRGTGTLAVGSSTGSRISTTSTRSSPVRSSSF